MIMEHERELVYSYNPRAHTASGHFRTFDNTQYCVESGAKPDSVLCTNYGQYPLSNLN